MLPASSRSGNPVAGRLEETGVPSVARGEPLGQGARVARMAADEGGGAHRMVRPPLARIAVDEPSAVILPTELLQRTSP
ncbi:hypothetical protein [Actinacidiphila sp. bgisy167]|uniref:hypothetical protein n=1 Tax=Actinacidiphila sp. bgisy167 TaxID=3413797 RepID=UPI003D74EA10